MLCSLLLPAVCSCTLRLRWGSALGRRDRGHRHPWDAAAPAADGESPSSARARQIPASSMQHWLKSDRSAAGERYLRKKPHQAQR